MTALGAVLTGGMSKRMGQDKADVMVREQTMLEMVSAALQPVSDQIVLLGPERDGWECWPDIVSAHGPLAGITTALQRTDHPLVVVVAVDHPFVRSQTLSSIIERAGDLPVVPVDDHGTRQVTCAVYPSSVGDAACEEADGGGSIQSLLDRVAFDPVTPEQWESWGEDGRSWFSVDDQADLDEGLARFS